MSMRSRSKIRFLRLLFLISCIGLVMSQGIFAYALDDERDDANDLAAEETPMDVFLQDFYALDSWEDRLKLVSEMRESASEALAADRWDGKSNWEYPLEPNTALMVSGLDEDSVDEDTLQELALLSVTTCNLNCSTEASCTYSDDVVVSGTGCVWRGYLKFNGNVTISTSGELRIIPYATTGNYTRVRFLNAADDTALWVYGSLSIEDDCSNCDNNEGTVDIQMRYEKDIQVYLCSSELSVTSSHAGGEINFYAYDPLNMGYTWNGIVGDPGSHIDFDGYYSSSEPQNDLPPKGGHPGVVCSCGGIQLA